MTAPLPRDCADVLAGIDWIAEWASDTTPTGGEAVYETAREARAAVAELIEAHKRLLDYVLSEAEARDYDPPVDTQIVADSMAALARATSPESPR